MEIGRLGVLEGHQRIVRDCRPVYVFGCVKVCEFGPGGVREGQMHSMIPLFAVVS
jgi:hypothetical protein